MVAGEKVPEGTGIYQMRSPACVASLSPAKTVPCWARGFFLSLSLSVSLSLSLPLSSYILYIHACTYVCMCKCAAAVLITTLSGAREMKAALGSPVQCLYQGSQIGN